MNTIEFEDTAFILGDAILPGVTAGMECIRSHKFGGNTPDNVAERIRGYTIPDQARQLADAHFPQIGEKLRAARGKTLEFDQEEGDFIPSHRLVAASQGETAVWAKWVPSDPEAVARKVTVVIDRFHYHGTPAEVLQARTTIALGLALAFDTAGMEFAVVAPSVRIESERRPDTEFLGVYTPKGFDAPLVGASFGCIADTDISRFVNCSMAHGPGGHSATSPVYAKKTTWEQIDALSDGSDAIVWIGGKDGEPEGEKPAWVYMLHVYKMDQVERAAQVLAAVIDGVTGLDQVEVPDGEGWLTGTGGTEGIARAALEALDEEQEVMAMMFGQVANEWIRPEGQGAADPAMVRPSKRALN